MPDLLPIASIRRDGGTQPRAALNLHWVEEYGQDMIAGASFPPVVVFYDGQVHWLADGFHRTEAALAVGLSEIQAEVHQGTVRDAILYSVGANGNHGQRRTNDDKRRAVKTLLNDAEWSRWSDREIARQCAVDHKTVAGLRPKPSGELPQIDQPQGRLVNRGGTTYTQKPRADAGDAKGKAAALHQPEGKVHVPERRTAEVAQGGNETLSPQADAHPVASGVPPNARHRDSAVANTCLEAAVAPEFDRVAADLHRQIMIAVATFGTIDATPRQAMDACNKHSGRGVLPTVVDQAAGWLRDFAALYAVEEPIRAQAVQEIFGAAE